MLTSVVIGCGQMGSSHARAYKALDGFELTGVCARGSSCFQLAAELDVDAYTSFDEALATNPDVVCIATYPDTHAEYAIRAMAAGAHVFVEKPLGVTLEEAEAVVAAAEKYNRKVVVGYILRHHPAWQRFIAEAQDLGKPLVMRLNLNQQSHGRAWDIHKKLMESVSPLVDCGVHYVDVMCQMTGARPVSVQAIGARLSDEIDPDMYNYGQLQITFDDGSVGWYETGWGPMISTTAHCIKDVVGPAGSVSIIPGTTDTADIDGHTAAQQLLVHRETDTLIQIADEPDHQELCNREQQYLLDAIVHDIDLTDHLRSAVDSLAIVLAADKSIRSESLYAADVR